MTDSLLLPSDDDQIEIDENKQYLSELVGEGKKYKDNETLAKSYYHADKALEISNRRQDQLREAFIKERQENIAKAKLQDLVDKLTNSKQTNSSNETPPVNEQNDKPAIDMDQIKSLMSTSLQEYEAGNKQRANLAQVQNKLVERYGKNYSKDLGEQLQVLGMSVDQIDALSKQAPQAAIRMLGLDTQTQREGFQSPPRSNQRNDSFAPKAAKKRTWSYYQELRKTNPDMYLDRKIANQMAQDAVELGEEFNDGDFYVSGLHER